MTSVTEISVTECEPEGSSMVSQSEDLMERRNSPSKIEAFKEGFMATGANFRPPFTPSNSLMSPPLSKAKLRRSRALDNSGSPAKKAQTTVPECRARPPRGIYANSSGLKDDKDGAMRSNSLKPNRNYRDFTSPNSVSSMRASSSNISDGSTSTPNSNRRFAHVKSRIDANNSSYVPSSSNVRIFHEPVRVKAQPRVGSLANASHTPAGGNVKIEHHKLSFKNSAKPRVDAKSTVEIPKSEKKILSQKLSWKAAPRVGSLANASHKPTGGNVKIFHQPIRLDTVQSKVGSLDNANHVPGGGEVKISEYKVRRSTSRSHNDAGASPGGGSLNSSRRSSSTAAFQRALNGTANLRIAS